MRIVILAAALFMAAMPALATDGVASSSQNSQPASASQTFPASQQPTVPNQGLPTDIGQLISALYKWSISIIGLVIFVRFFYAGFLWFTAAGNSGPITQAKEIMQNAGLGAVVLFSAYIILYTINPDLVSNAFNVPGLPGVQAEP